MATSHKEQGAAEKEEYAYDCYRDPEGKHARRRILAAAAGSPRLQPQGGQTGSTTCSWTSGMSVLRCLLTFWLTTFEDPPGVMVTP